MNGANRLVSTMASVGKNTVSEVLFGRVSNISPLEIAREGEEGRAPLTEEFLVLSKMCREFKIKSGLHNHLIVGANIPVQNAGSHTHNVPAAITESGGTTEPHTHNVSANIAQAAGSHNHSVGNVHTNDALTELLIWPGLSVGERVILLSFNDNQRYFVERLEKLSNEV